MHIDSLIIFFLIMFIMYKIINIIVYMSVSEITKEMEKEDDKKKIISFFTVHNKEGTKPNIKNLDENIKVEVFDESNDMTVFVVYQLTDQLITKKRKIKLPIKKTGEKVTSK